MANYLQESAPAADDGGLWIKTSTGEIFFGQGGSWTNTSAVVDFATFADQAHIAATDTMLLRTAAGAGVEVPGSHVLARRADNGPFIGDKGLQLNGSLSLSGVPAEDHGASFAIDFATYSSMGQHNGGTSHGWWGWNVRGDAAVGQYRYRVTGDIASVLELTSSGDLVFKNAAVGTAGTVVGLSTRYEFQASGTLAPGFDNAQDLGSASRRWGTLFAGTGTINTSDEREKSWLQSGLTDDQYAAGLRLLKEIGTFTIKDGGERIHWGVRAQRAWEICAEYDMAMPLQMTGAGKFKKRPSALFAFLCFDQWDEVLKPIFKPVKKTEKYIEMVSAGKNEDGIEAYIAKDMTREITVQEDSGKTKVARKAGDRFGIRYDEFNQFLIAVLTRQQGELDKRLEALEAA